MLNSPNRSGNGPPKGFSDPHFQTMRKCGFFVQLGGHPQGFDAVFMPRVFQLRQAILRVEVFQEGLPEQHGPGFVNPFLPPFSATLIVERTLLYGDRGQAGIAANRPGDTIFRNGIRYEVQQVPPVRRSDEHDRVDRRRGRDCGPHFGHRDCVEEYLLKRSIALTHCANL